MKIHWFSIIKYAVIFLLIMLFIQIFKQNYLVFLLFPYVLLPAVTIPLYMKNVERLVFSGRAEAVSVQSGNSVTIFVQCQNPTVIPFLKCSVSFTVKNLFYDNSVTHILNMASLPSRTSSVDIPIGTSKIGMMYFEINEVTIYDFLGIVSKKMPVSVRLQVPVLPEDAPAPVLPDTPSSEGFDEYAEPDLKGNISSDVKEIREYRPGDRMSRIHWKLSAKLDDLFVKEMERTSVMSLVVLPELCVNEIESTVATLNSIIKLLLSREERFEVCLFNNNACEFSYYMIDNEDSFNNCFMNLYYMPLYDKPGTAIDAYYASLQKSSLILQLHGSHVTMYEDGEILNKI